MSYARIAEKRNLSFAVVRNHISKHVGAESLSVDAPSGTLAELQEQQARLKAAIILPDTTPAIRAKLENILLRVVEALARMRADNINAKGSSSALDRDMRNLVKDSRRTPGSS